MGIPEWFLTVDSRKTRTLHSDACIQILLHFKGPIAKKLEQDFSHLMVQGRLESPSLYIPGYFDEKRKVKISYKQCGVRDPNDKESSKKRKSFLFGSISNTPKIIVLSNFVLLINLLCANYHYLL